MLPDSELRLHWRSSKACLLLYQMGFISCQKVTGSGTVSGWDGRCLEVQVIGGGRGPGASPSQLLTRLAYASSDELSLPSFLPCLSTSPPASERLKIK